jgi:hypothetical protein
MKKFKYLFLAITFFSCLIFTDTLYSQQNFSTHTRGKLWETLYNWGFIGDPGAWDYNETTGIGFYPGFPGFDFPRNEIDANGYITDANFHNFRSGPWILVKGAKTLIPPDWSPENRDFILYHSSLATGIEGVVESSISPFSKTKNFVESQGFDPRLPEEMNYVEFHTSTGVTVKQRSMAWSFPGYDDFIIYDYTFVNSGFIAIPAANQVFPLQQPLNEVWIVFHTGIQNSTKGRLNFFYNPDFQKSTAPAGAFGWKDEGGLYDDYYAIENDLVDGKGLLYYSRDYNGGREPSPWNTYMQKTNWRNDLRLRPEWLPELQDPAAFGFTFLYRTPYSGSNGDPFDADPAYFNIYSDGVDKFKGKTVDFEGFGLDVYKPFELYDFAKHSKRASNNGHLYCWYTSSFGPYSLASGDSVRLIVAEIAGVMDMNQVMKGDPDHWLKTYDEDWQNDSTNVHIRRNTEALRKAIEWGIGAKVDGIDIAADVPESPPAPNCSAVNESSGSDTAIIAVSWDDLAEKTIINNGVGQPFYNGLEDLDGYRIFRGIDKRGIWELIKEIPRADFNNFWNAESNIYKYLDKTVQFGFEYNYYVQAYNSNPRTWTSINGTIVENLGELLSSDLNKSTMVSAKPGPVSVKGGWDVFVVPNPFVDDDPLRNFAPISQGELHYKIEFRNLPEKATIKIFNIAGDLITTLKHGPDASGNLYGTIEWYQRSNSGLLVAPGLYIYVIESEAEESLGSRTTGKFMIIR